MSDLSELESLAEQEYINRTQAEEEEKARWRLTPEGELPTADFTGAPATAHAVNTHPAPNSMQKEWDQMAWWEKLLNSAGGGFHNQRKSNVMQDIAHYAIAREEGIVGSLKEDLEERFGDDEESKKKFDEHLRGTYLDDQYKAEQEEKLKEAINEFQELSVYDKDYKTPDVVIRASQATEGKSFLDSIAPFMSEVAKNPMDYMLYLTGSSTGAIAPSLALSMVSGVGIGRLLKMKTTARAVQTALMGYGSYNVELGSYIMDALQEKGYDLQDADSMLKAMNTEDIAGLLKKGQRRAAVVGMFDAFSAWIAPMRLNPSNALRFLRSNATKATTGLVAPVSRTVRFGKGMENLALQTSLQGVLGGAGEAFGQVVNGEKINWGEVFAEAIGEFSSAPFEVLGLSWSVNKEFNTETQRYQDAKKVEDLGNQVCTAVRAINQKIGDDRTVAQWAEGVGQNTQMFAFAQDLVDQKIPDKIRETNPELAQKIEEAAKQKQDVTVPVSEILKVATKDETTAKTIANNSRLDADGMTPVQAEEFEKNGKKKALEEFQQIMEKNQPKIENRKQIDARFDKVQAEMEEQLVKAGKNKDDAHALTMPWRAHFAMLANWMGKSPDELFKQLETQIQKITNQMKEQAFAQRKADVRGTLEGDAQALTDFINTAENPEEKKKAIDNLLELMSTAKQKDIVQETKAPSQKTYQKGINSRVLDAAQKAGVDLSDMENPVTRALVRQTIVNDALHVAKTNPSAVGWYDLKVRLCLAFSEQVFPELNPKGEKFNPNELFKFLYILAVTSNGQKVTAQFRQTIDLYKEYKKTGKIPVKAFGPQGQAIAHALKNFPNLTEKFGGMDNMRKFFMTAWTVRQMTMMGFDVSGEAADEIVRGAMLLGPKIGNGFLCNMYGIFSALTMDRWFMRTYGRWTGTLIDFKPEALNEKLVDLKTALQTLKSNRELAKFVKKELGFNISDALKLLSSKKKIKGIISAEEALTGERSDLAKMVLKAASTIMGSEYHNKFIKQWGEPGQLFYDSVMRVYRSLLTDKQSPSGAIERKYIRGLFNDALEVLHTQPGMERLTMADLQALLWYAEKKIYENTKTNPGDEFVEDYESDEAPDYANAMYEVALEEGVPKETLDSIKEQIEKEVADEQRRAEEGTDSGEGSNGIRHDSLSDKAKVNVFRSLCFGALRSLRKLSHGKNDKKQSQRSKTTYGKKWEVGDPELLSANGSDGSTVSDNDVRRNRQNVRGFQSPAIAEWAVGSLLRGRLKEVKTSFGKPAQGVAPKFFEFAPTEQSATEFLEALRAAKQSQGIAGLCVEEKSIEELTGKDVDHSQCRIFLSEDKKCGFVIKNGDDLVSVFSTRGQGSGDAIVECAIAAGARRLDCFNTILPEFYATHGFRPVARLSFDPNYAPEGWDYNYFNKFNEGKPDIIFMVLDNDFNGFINPNDLANLPETQDYGTTECNAALEKYGKNNAVIQEAVDEATASYNKPQDTLNQSPLTQYLLQLAYHGSPYPFEKFSLDFIGKGEGAQVHGWGLYFALNRAVAEGYRKRLGGKNPARIDLFYKGKDLRKFSDELSHEAYVAEEEATWLEPETKVKAKKLKARANIIDSLYYGVNPRKSVQSFIDERREYLKKEEYSSVGRWARDEFYEDLKYREEALDWLEKEILPDIEEKRSGPTLYTVDIPDDDVMLREDARFNEQPPKVQEALRKIWEEVIPHTNIIKKKKAWLDAVKTSQEIKDALQDKPETYKAFIALAEAEGPAAFEDLGGLRKKLKTAINKDARVARQLNLKNGIDDTLEEVADAIWDEMNMRSSALSSPYHLARSDEFDGLVEFSKRYNSQFKEWMKGVRELFDDDGEYFASPKFRKSLIDAAKEHGPQIFQDEKALFKAIKPVWIKEAESLIREDPNLAKDVAGSDDRMPTAEEVARGWFNNMLNDYNVLSLYNSAARHYRTLIASDTTPLENNVHGWKIYNELKQYFHSAMEASLTLNKYGVKGIRYDGRRDGECAVVFDDTTIKIVDMLNQLAYHGTGYERDILQFTLDHVGEGEGAQAHGYGLYFALLQQVARNYKDKLSSNSYQVQGQDDTGFRMQLEQSANAQKGEERKKLFDRLAAFDEWYANHNVDAVKEAYERGEITEDAYKWFNKEVAPNITSSGGLYLVDIPNDNVLLHEASAFEDQPAEVQEAVKKLFKNEFSKEQLIDFYREQWYSDAMEQMQDYSEYISVPNPVLRALDKLAKEEGPQIFADEKKVLRKIASAINEAAEEEYSQNKDEYEGSTKREAIKEIKENIIKEAGLNADGIFDTLYSVATDNYPSLLSGNPEFELSNTVHGFEIYNKIAQLAGSKKEASALLNKYGVKGIRYTGIEDGECAVVWDEESIKILDRLQQMGEQLKSQTTQGPRGSYIPKNTAEQYRQSVITLMENSDESTFLHESAHAFLDIDTMLAKDIAEKMDRGEEITVGEAAFMKNLGGFFKWGQQEGVIDLGVTDDIRTVAEAAKRWSNLTLAEQRGMHELFAEGFEAYCMEGVAPNKEMEDIFSRFKKWLIDVYSKLMHQPKPISREVRKLYDLMFATEQQAIETETKLGFRAMFDMDMAKKLGMTEEELRQYLILNDQATQETAGLVAKKVHGAMRIFGRVRKAEARRIENERRKEIKKREEELRKEPRYKALSMLNSNKVKMSEESLRALGLKDETIDLFKSRGWVSEDGMAVPVLASTLGTDDTMGLISDLVDLERMSDLHEEVIKQLAWEDKVEHNGEGDFRELQADLCAYNETRSRLLVAEFNAIMRKLGGQQLMVRAAREYAFDQINQMKVSDVHEKSFMAAERRCAKEAEQAFIKGDFNAVIEAKRGQILNHELARAALEAKDRFQRGKNAAKSALKSKTVHPFYKRIVDALLTNHSVSQMSAKDREEFGLGAPLSEDEISGIEAKLQENGTPCEGLAKLLRDHTHTQEMTVGDADAFFRVVTQITANGRNLLKLSKIREGERVDETVKELEEQADKAGKAQGRERNLNLHEPQTSAQRRKKSVMDFLLGNTKISAWCKILDMNKAGGIFWEVFIKPANECATFEAEQRKRAAEWLRDKLLPAFKKNEDEDPIHIEGFKEPLTHGVRLAVALNLGNESNRQRLVQNDPRFTPEALQQITDTLTEADWRAVEAVWQLFESFRPMIAEKELRVNGIEPEWIEYEPFQVTTKEGKLITVSGGYYPVVYDYEASERSGVLEEAKKAERMMQGAYQSPTTDRSFTKKRVPGEVTGRPLRLNLSVLYEGVNDVIHDLAWHEWLIDTGHILHGSTMSQTDGIKQTIKELYGSGVANEFEQWRMDIALGDRGVGTPAWFSALTRNVGMASMGYSLTTAAAQLTGVGYVIPQTGVPAFLHALTKYMAHPFSMRKNINASSDAMRLRAQTQFKELAQIRNRLQKGKGTIAWMQDHAFVLTELVQSFADTVAWQAAYEKFSRDGFEGDKLIKMCDQVVVSTQASGNIHDLSRFERNKGYAKIFGVFYSWMNAALNLAVTEALGETNKFKKFANLFFMCVLMPYIEQSFRDALSADGDDDDDKDKDAIDKYVRDPIATVVEYNLGTLMFVREASNTAGRVIKGEPIFGYSGPAGLRTFKTANDSLAVLGRLAETYEDPNYDRLIKNIIDVAGAAIGAPSTQIKRTMKGLKAVDQGKVEGIDAIKAPLFGYNGKVE